MITKKVGKLCDIDIPLQQEEHEDIGETDSA